MQLCEGLEKAANIFYYIDTATQIALPCGAPLNDSYVPSMW